MDFSRGLAGNGPVARRIATRRAPVVGNPSCLRHWKRRLPEAFSLLEAPDAFGRPRLLPGTSRRPRLALLQDVAAGLGGACSAQGKPLRVAETVVLPLSQVLRLTMKQYREVLRILFQDPCRAGPEIVELGGLNSRSYRKTHWKRSGPFRPTNSTISVPARPGSYNKIHKTSGQM